MKDRSITLKIFLVFISFTIGIFILIGLSTTFLLPKYYINKKTQTIEDYKTQIEVAYNANNYEEVFRLFDGLSSDTDGDLYILDQSGQSKGVGKYIQNGNNNTNNSDINGDIFENIHTNKYDIEIYSFGVNIEGEYLVYETSIQSISGTINTMIEFLLILLVISIMIAIAVSYLISINITKPIKALNRLAKDMKDKTIQAKLVTENQDEIGQLNQSINLLYEELLSNIQKLEAELQKERSLEKLKKQFLAQATHELKTPLAVIGGYAELIQDGIYKDDTEHDSFVNNIYNETQNMNALIMDILDYSKMETGFYKLNKEDTFVNPWLNKIVSVFKNIADSKELNLEVNNHVGDLCVNMDAFRVEQVIKNLLSNALEHSNKDIMIKASNLNNELKIEVFNTGSHIEESDLAFVFDSFYKKEGKQTGTGLGLAIVKGIVEAHDGQYRVENTSDGVRFVVIIP